MSTTVSDALAEVLAAYGVRRVFGVPGGGSSLEIIDSCAGRGIDYVLAHTETAAAIMAAVTGEMTGTPGVVSTGLGPGAASVVNGVAYAALDRAPMLVLTDAFRPGAHDFITHQRVDHAALFAPLVKAHARADAERPGETLAGLLDRALKGPRGPVHLDLSAVDAGQSADLFSPPRPAARAGAAQGDGDAARRLIGEARRPAIVAGMQARGADAAAALGVLAEAMACPVLTTYKAKGVWADGDPRHAGLFTGGRSEAQWLADCDLLVLYGVDPVELVASPWPYRMPVLELAESEIRPHYTTPAASLFGPLPALAEIAAKAARPANWPEGPAPLALPDAAGNGVLSPHAVVRAAARAAPAGARATVDAGAHMLPAMEAWPAKRPFDVQISHGLSTMGFAVPAAIAATLAEPDRPVVALTGDGGMAMCLAELATLARNRLPVAVVVLNDAALTLIDVKQEQRGFARRGMRYPALDFARIAEGAGMTGVRADSADAVADAVAGLAGGGPVLVDARIDASGYRAMFEALRGAPGVAANA